jgi:hypothetical protein
MVIQKIVEMNIQRQLGVVARATTGSGHSMARPETMPTVTVLAAPQDQVSNLARVIRDIHRDSSRRFGDGFAELASDGL